MDIAFKINGKANQYFIDEMPATEELRTEIVRVLREELDIFAEIEITDYYEI